MFQRLHNFLHFYMLFALVIFTSLPLNIATTPEANETVSRTTHTPLENATSVFENVTSVNSTVFEVAEDENITTAEVITTTTQEETTTPSTKTAKENAPEKSLHQGQCPSRKSSITPCACDLTVNTCDIKCCCDKDCCEDDLEVFGCHPFYDDRYCFVRDFIYKNNTLFQKRPVADMLCIFMDNVIKEIKFHEPHLVTSEKQFNKIVDSSGYKWQSEKTEFQQGKKVKVGDPLFVTEESGAREWKLPAKLFSSKCEVNKQVQYLIDEVHSCQQVVLSLVDECEEYDALNYKTYSKNISLNSACQKSSDCISVNPVDCFGDSKICQQPQLNATLRVCNNVVSKVAYLVTHNRTNILSVQAKIELVNLNITTQIFPQQFEIKFLSDAVKNNTYPYSGNPGYQIGYPVLSGIKTSNTEEYFLDIESDPKMWLSVPKGQLDGKCAGLQQTRVPVKFGINVRTGCTITFDKSSPNLQELVYQSLLGPKNHTHVGAYGNANSSVPEDWVKIISTPEERFSSFDSMVLGLNVYILFAKTGHTSNIQNKIVGVMYLFENPTEVKHLAVLEVKFSVMFLDVSKPFVQVFAPPPVIEARLPYDFFYPFLLNSCVPLWSQWRAIVILQFFAMTCRTVFSP